MGARPRTLPAAIAPVVVGSALAYSDFNAFHALLALIVSLALQIGVNYANDYSDGIRGTDENRIGPTRITAAGLASAAAVKRAAFISFGIGALSGLLLSALTSWWLIAVGLSAILAGWGYTGGKNPYGYLGLGELFVFLYFGVVATTGTYFVQTNVIDVTIIFISISMGSFACALLAINNIRDRALDAEVGKRTLAVRLGDSKSRYFFIALLLFGYSAAIAVLLPWGLLTLLTFPLAFSLIRGVLSGAAGSSLIPLLGKTGKLQLAYSVLLSFAIFIAQQ
jgi:1,4-dihydroxy-2-naphthoate octaprenyltransferase